MDNLYITLVLSLIYFVNTDLVGIGKCVTGIKGLEPYMDCVKGDGNTTDIDGNTTDICSITQMSIDCVYKYVDLRCPKYIDRFEEYIKATNVANCTVVIGKDTPKTCDENMSIACATESQKNITSTTEAIQWACSEDGIASTTCERKWKTICINLNQSVFITLPDLLPSADKTRKMCADKEKFKKYSECYSKFDHTLKFQTCATSQGVKFCSYLKQTHTCTELAIQEHCPSSSNFYQNYMPYELEAGHMCAVTSSGTSVTSSAAVVNFPSVAYLLIFLLSFKIFN